MPRFRKVDRVEKHQANLAYVGIPSVPANSMIDIVDPNRSFGSAKRRIMYGDLSGRLVDINGDPTVNVAYPVVSDLFYDRDSDRELDADEVVPEAALSYRYRSNKTYYGKAVYPTTTGAIREQSIKSGLTASVIADSSAYLTLSQADYNALATAAGGSGNLVGMCIKPTSMTWTMAGGIEEPSKPIGQYRTITAKNDGTYALSYDSQYAPDDTVAVGTLTFDVVKILSDEAHLYSLVGTENIKLIHPDGSEYKGHCMIMLQRAGSQSEVVIENDVEYACSYVHVFIDRSDIDLYLKFPAASISSDGTGGYARAGDIDKDHIEAVNAIEMFRYASMDSVTDPVNEGKDIVASVPLGLSHGIYVTDRAFVDQRIIDPLMWRIRADIKRSTPVKSDTGLETLKIGVIGDVPKSLDDFLKTDPTYAFRMTCSNPFPKTGKGSSSTFEIDITKVIDWATYDVVIYRGWNIEWSTMYQYAASVINGGGLFIIDTSDSDVMIDGHKSEADREKNVPSNLALEATFAPALTTADHTIPDSLKSVEGGYVLSDDDLKLIFPRVTHAAISYNETKHPKRRKFVEATADAATASFMVEIQSGLLLSTLGFSSVDNEPTKQFFCNLIWGYGAQDPTRTLSNATLIRTFYSSWETSWVAGWNINGEPILTESEMEKYGFYKRLDEQTAVKRLMRRLSDRTASTIIAEALVAQSSSDFLNGADSVTYMLELAGHDPDNVMFSPGLDGSAYPEAWSTRKDSPVFDVQDGYLVRSYMEEPNPGAVPGGPQGVDATVRVVGTMVMLDETEFTFSASQGYSYDTRYTVTKEVPLTSGSGYVDLVTTWSDVNWTAPNIWRDHDVRSDYNLEHYGLQTATKWYPWDGHTFLASNSGDHGDYVKYVQKALNALHAAGRSPKHGTLKVDGVYGSKTQAAVHAYQVHWGLTDDADVDAGTLGHILRNAGTITSWASLDDRWKKYGPLNNMIDGSDSTLGGRRTWVNTHVTRMVDEIYIQLKSGMKVTKIEIEPYMLGDGAEKYLHIHKIGGRRADDHRKYDWSFDYSKSMSSAWKIKHATTDSRSLTLPNDVDLLTIGLYQDNPYSGRARQWGVKNVIAYGNVTSTETRTQYDALNYNPKLDVSLAEHTIDVGTTITTVKDHGYGVGDEVWLSGFATSGVDGKWTITSVPRANVFTVKTTPAATTNESDISSAVCRNLSIKLRTGEKKTITLQPTLPPNSTFKGWDAVTAAGDASAIATAIKESISPSYASGNTAVNRISVSVTVGTRGELYVTFSSPLENADSEVSIGRELPLHLGPTQLYGLDPDTDSCVVSASSATTVTDATKYWPESILAGGRITFTSGALNGQSFDISNNTTNQITTVQNMGAIANDDTFVVSHPHCDAGAVAMTAGAGSGSNVIGGLSSLGTNTLVGCRVLFTSGTNDRKSCLITANTNTTISIADGLTVAQNDTFLLLTGHWPTFDKVDEDVAFVITYRVDVVIGNQKVMGIFAIVNGDGEVVDIMDRISLSDIKRYGLDNVKIGVTNLHLWGDPTIGGLDRFPVRYAMKPFCVTEKSHGTYLDVIGLSGDQTSEIWGLLIESATVKNTVRIPSGLCASPGGENNVSAYATLLSDAQSKTVTCIYNVSTGTYSPTYGEPFVDIADETLDVSEWQKVATSHLVAASVTMAPLHADDSGIPIVSAKLNGSSSDITVSGADIDRGTVFLTVSKEDYDPANDVITVDYTYREQYVAYKGAGVSESGIDVLDLCPYHGHVISTPSGLKATSDMIGQPIYIYAMPTTVKVDSTVITNTRCLNHTTYRDMFDSSSPFYNPFAMLLAIVTIKGIGSDADVTIIDTRTGGGGLVDALSLSDEAHRHRTGFYESDGFFDIGHMDGDAYLLGGSVVVELPLSWKTAWTGYGQDIDKMISEFCTRWLAPGKTHTIVWRDDTE